MKETRALCETCSALPGGPETWHFGVVARWWALFNTDGPEIAYFRRRRLQGRAADTRHRFLAFIANKSER
jgi:hypothetical protein